MGITKVTEPNTSQSATRLQFRAAGIYAVLRSCHQTNAQRTVARSSKLRRAAVQHFVQHD
jgi:hypothetical protein